MFNKRDEAIMEKLIAANMDCSLVTDPDYQSPPRIIGRLAAQPLAAIAEVSDTSSNE
jgi:hypothetical protein